jgi:nucleoside-diphosphate-sugar epimerase
LNRVLITGVAGFIGSNLANKLLAEGYHVVGLDNLSTGTRENVPAAVEFHQGDIRNRNLYPLFQGVDAVFHLAAKTSLPACLKDPVEAADINVTGTANVLEACRQAAVRRVVYADTSAEYEGVPDVPSRVERIRPVSAYAISKRGGALFCEMYQRFYGLDIITVRYFNVYGPAQDWMRIFPPVVSSFTTQLLSGKQPTIYGTGEKRRDFVYVDDVNDLHLTILRDDCARGGTFNVGSGSNYSINEMFELIEAELKTGLKPKYAPELPGEAEVTLAEISNSLALGWRPKVSLREGLRRSIDYYRERISSKLRGNGQ